MLIKKKFWVKIPHNQNRVTKRLEATITADEQTHYKII